MKDKKKINFEVVYTPELATKVFDLMSKLDLGITGGEAPVCYEVSWSTTTKITSDYIKKMEKKVEEAFRKIGITQIHSIKYIKN